MPEREGKNILVSFFLCKPQHLRKWNNLWITSPLKPEHSRWPNRSDLVSTCHLSCLFMLHQIFYLSYFKWRFCSALEITWFKLFCLWAGTWKAQTHTFKSTGWSVACCPHSTIKATVWNWPVAFQRWISPFKRTNQTQRETVRERERERGLNWLRFPAFACLMIPSPGPWMLLPPPSNPFSLSWFGFVVSRVISWIMNKNTKLE